MVRMIGLSFLVLIAQLASIDSASAQLRPRSGRFWLDTDLFSVGTVNTEIEDTDVERRTTAIGVGPNQLGNSRVTIPTTPLGVGAAYVLDPKWMIGLRLGFGYDWYSSGPEQRVLAFSATPEVTFVPKGDDRDKLFLKVGPLVQYDHIKINDDKVSDIAGGFSVGAGVFHFVGPAASFDVGAFFEGRFGKVKEELDSLGAIADQDVKIRDLRGVLRVSVSLWSHDDEERDHEAERRQEEERRRLEQQTMPPPSYAPPAPMSPPPAQPLPPASTTPPSTLPSAGGVVPSQAPVQTPPVNYDPGRFAPNTVSPSPSTQPPPAP